MIFIDDVIIWSLSFATNILEYSTITQACFSFRYWDQNMNITSSIMRYHTQEQKDLFVIFDF